MEPARSAGVYVTEIQGQINLNRLPVVQLRVAFSGSFATGQLPGSRHRLMDLLPNPPWPVPHSEPLRVFGGL
jgi:hypothetical protein